MCACVQVYACVWVCKCGFVSVCVCVCMCLSVCQIRLDKLIILKNQALQILYLVQTVYINSVKHKTFTSSESGL